MREYALVVQRIGHKIADLETEVRFLSGAYAFAVPQLRDNSSWGHQVKLDSHV